MSFEPLPLRRGADHLTEREQEILGLIGRGLSLSAIARHIHRSPKTVAAHRLRLGKKLGLHNRVELARAAIQQGLTPLAGFLPTKAPPPWISRIPSTEAKYVAGEGEEPADPNSENDGVAFGWTYLVAEILDVSHAFISEVTDRPASQTRILAMWCKRGQLTDGGGAAIAALCSATLHRGVFVCRSGLVSHAPGIAHAVGSNVDSYLGLTIKNTAGAPVGILGVLNEQEVDDSPRGMALLELVAQRAARDIEEHASMRQIPSALAHSIPMG